MMGEHFSTGSPPLNPFDIQVEPFKENQDVKQFTCGNEDLDEFLTTDEVTNYDEEGLGKTSLVYLRENLVGYFTVCNDGLRVEYMRSFKAFKKPPKVKVEAYPAVKIGRLATANDWQRKGIGKAIVAHIAMAALESGTRFGVRLLIVEAKPGSIGFYEKCGFVLTKETRRQRGRVNRTMFVDLQKFQPLMVED